MKGGDTKWGLVMSVDTEIIAMKHGVANIQIE